jgi:L-ribulokinase
MYASVAAGIDPSIEAAQAAMDGGIDCEYSPNPERAGRYRDLHRQYVRLGRMVEQASGQDSG